MNNGLTEAAMLTVKKFAICISATDEGVVVDIWRAGKDDDFPISTTYAFDSECEDEEESE
jgi:hypothetical protein